MPSQSGKELKEIALLGFIAVILFLVAGRCYAQEKTEDMWVCICIGWACVCVGLWLALTGKRQTRP